MTLSESRQALVDALKNEAEAAKGARILVSSADILAIMDFLDHGEMLDWQRRRLDSLEAFARKATELLGWECPGWEMTGHVPSPEHRFAWDRQCGMDSCVFCGKVRE